ncbi:MAG: lycopene cyclase domain-containing protein [Bacteroidetes bacterium]|nr:lycopene cyclase domain-containing protein [Bacteroidota bacterium]
MTYTALVLVAAALAVVLDLAILRTRILLTRRYAVFLAVMLLFFLVVNGILTGLPVVMYAPQAITGFRVITIPIEDFAYLFALVTPTIALYEYLSPRRASGAAQHEEHR